MAAARSSRDEWRKRVERWKDSGLTAVQFASEMGINAGTLQFWRSKLKQKGHAKRRRRPTADAILSSLVEVRAPTHVSAETRFEIQLGRDRRLLVPPTFEANALKKLLAALEDAR